MLQKWPYLDQKTKGYPFWKYVNFLHSWTSFFNCLERRFFILDYRKRHFPNQYCLKNKFGKMAIFGPKPCVNPFRKTLILQHFELLVFIAKKGVFFLLEYCKRHLPNLYCLKKEVWKIESFGPKPWVNPFGKISIFWLLKLLVFIA